MANLKAHISFREINKLKLNLLFIYLFNFIWSFGNPMINISTMIASFYDRLNCEPVVFGLIQICSSLPVVIQFLPRIVNLKAEHPKKTLFILYEINGIGYIVYGVLAMYAERNPALLVPILLVVYFLIFCISQLAIVMYLNYISNLFPGNILGRFYGIKGFLMSAGSILGGFISMYLLNKAEFPVNFGITYIIAGSLFMIATFFVLFTMDDDVIVAENKSFERIRTYISHMAVHFKNKTVRSFMYLMMLVYAMNVPTGYVLVYLNRGHSMNIDPVFVTLISYFSQAVLIVIVGQCMDRVGRYITISGYLTCAAAANLLILIPGQSYILMYGIYGMYALFINMMKVRLANEIIPQEIRFDIIILVNVTGVLTGSLLSLIYGVIIQIFSSYEFIFVITSLCVILIYFITARLKKISLRSAIKE